VFQVFELKKLSGTGCEPEILNVDFSFTVAAAKETSDGRTPNHSIIAILLQCQSASARLRLQYFAPSGSSIEDESGHSLSSASPEAPSGQMRGGLQSDGFGSGNANAAAAIRPHAAAMAEQTLHQLMRETEHRWSAWEKSFA
jgi:hypothetical protein